MLLLTAIYLTLITIISAENCPLKLKENSFNFPFTEIDGEIIIDKYCINYYIVTQKNRYDYQSISESNELNKTYFDPSKFTVIFVHGYYDKGDSYLSREMSTILGKNDINLIIVDWKKYSFIKYDVARYYVKNIGEIVGEFIGEIEKMYNLTGSDFLLTGHSTGAHIAGNVNNVLQDKIVRIIGLDPAGPLFNEPSEDRLSTSHAKLVEIIHTDAGRFGIIDSVGHKNYHVNGGIAQKGCPHDFAAITVLVGLCDHIRSVTYFAESVGNGAKFEGVKCDSYQSYLLGKCNNNPKSIMGGLHTNNDNIIQGNYYLETGTASPYAIIDEKTKQLSVEEKLKLFKFEETYYGNITKSKLDPLLLSPISPYNILF